ncbi:MAG: MBL fold metallo-hydrolase [Thermocrispum sp.]
MALSPPPTHGVSRRTLLAGSLGAALAGPAAVSALAAPASAQTGARVPDTGTHLVTLGTAAGPAVRSERRGIATAVVVDGDLYLVDCGLGVVRQAIEAALPMKRMRAVLLTHLHSDHIAELPALLLYNWGPQVNGFVQPFDVLGPDRAGALPAGARTTVAPPTPGTEDLVRHLLSAYAYDINVRVHDEARPRLDQLVRPSSITLPRGTPARARGELAPPMEPFEIYADDKVRVHASLVHHPPVFPAYGFRIETPHGVVALSGDTAEHPNVIALARDADLLVHEGVYLDYYKDRGLPDEFINHLAESHTDPAGIGRVAQAADVQHVVLSHLAGVATDQQWSAPVRERFGGDITVATDGQVFSL